MIKNDYGVKVKPTTTRNPQANAIVERVHQTIGNMIRTFELYDNDGIDDDDPWSGILAAVMAAVRSTYSTTTQATPMQLVFGRDAIINTKFIADWDYIRQRKQNIIHNNNERENAKRIPHTYQISDKIMLKNTTSTSMAVLSTKAHTQSQRLMITVLYVFNGVSYMTASISEISSLTISE